MVEVSFHPRDIKIDNNVAMLALHSAQFKVSSGSGTESLMGLSTTDLKF
jgi:hypothetical protein